MTRRGWTYQHPNEWVEWDWSLDERPTVLTLRMFHCLDCMVTTQLVDDHTTLGRAVAEIFHSDHVRFYHKTVMLCDTALVEGEWTPAALQSLADLYTARIAEVKARL